MKMEGKLTGSPHFERTFAELTRSIVEDLANNRSPIIRIDRFRNYCTDDSGNCYCSSGLSNGKEFVTLKRECHARRLDVLLRVLQIVQQLLQENRHGSKRDIYYMHPSVFKEQATVDRAINDICILLQCSRHNLNVVSVGNGLVMGWLQFVEAGRKFDCINSPNTAHPIPVYVEEVERSSNLFIIHLQGRGYPDVPTRRFLQLLTEKLCLPTYCLVDCDPYGVDILATYRFGSMQMAYDAKFLRVPGIRWLGAFPLDCDTYCVPKQCLLPLTEEDKRRAQAMLQRCYMQREVPKWRIEIEVLLEKGVKYELEALSACSLSFLTEEYIPSKIQGGGYI
ncbi:hypothetical protein DM860_000487 [Cuscuta australis]|uniref:DNA topoisomerase (ATP-hydrolyzing) n=1 Tax=Cuscuta australis TaxID=267555 RepID=A0A328D1R5_9ASTE|nr:hypothetical protein DM860_000487 [Cuscuta australis]